MTTKRGLSDPDESKWFSQRMLTQIHYMRRDEGVNSVYLTELQNSLNEGEDWNNAMAYADSQTPRGRDTGRFAIRWFVRGYLLGHGDAPPENEYADPVEEDLEAKKEVDPISGDG